jgi:hypothetical protein
MKSVPSWCAALLVAVFAGGCAAQPMPPMAQGQTYEVVAPLFSLKGGPTQACNGILLSLPPAGCGGVLVRGVDITLIPGLTRYWNGTMETPAQRLVGVWSPSTLTLTLTEPAQPGNYPATPPEAQCPPNTPAIESQLLALEQQVAQDGDAIKRHGIALMEFGPCGDALPMLVAVADTATIDYLKGTYGKVAVSGWLTPVD